MTGEIYPEFGDGVAIVAGGSGGIGAAIVRDLAAHGSNVALTYHSNRAAAEALSDDVGRAGREAEIGRLDLQDAEAAKSFVDGVVARFGRLHSVVYAAGPPLKLDFISQLRPDTWSKVFRADVDGCFNLIWACLPHLKRQGGGSVVAVITAAVDRPPPKDILSAAPKAAIQALIRGLAREEGRFGIRARLDRRWPRRRGHGEPGPAGLHRPLPGADPPAAGRPGRGNRPGRHLSLVRPREIRDRSEPARRRRPSALNRRGLGRRRAVQASNRITERASSPVFISSKASLICSSLIRREISSSSFSLPDM
jgi:NADP-dependent 3-hydroxy acid dehydrogenase YdfG